MDMSKKWLKPYFAAGLRGLDSTEGPLGMLDIRFSWGVLLTTLCLV